MLGILNFLIGIGLAAGAAIINPAIQGANFIKNLGINLLDASTEFIGDGTQGLIGHVVKAIHCHRECERLKKMFATNLVNIDGNGNASEGDNVKINEDIKKIIKEIRDYQEDEESERNGKKTAPRKVNVKKCLDTLNNNDVRAIMKMSADLVFSKNISEYLECSSTYKKLAQSGDKKEEVKTIELLIEITVDTYVKDTFYKMPDDFKVLAYIMKQTLKECDSRDSNEHVVVDEKDYGDLVDKLIDKLLPFVANQNGGVINPQVIASAKYAPKYIMRACPGCGYDGPRILVDEKNNSVHCAACGKTYDVLQYIEPEICTEIDKKVNVILNDSEEIKDLIKDQNEENKRQIAELKEQLKEQYKAQLTREYLDACLKDQTDSFEEKFKEIVNEQEKLTADFRGRISNVISLIESQGYNLQELKENVSATIEMIEAKNEEDRRINAHLSQKLDSLGDQIASLYKYAKEQFAGLDDKSDRILEYVEKMCSKEYYEEMSNALGTDINKAIAREMETGYSNIAALNATSISQILAAIDDLKNSNTNSDGKVDVSQLEKAIQKENAQLSGQITGLQYLIESNHQLLNSKMDANHQESLTLLRIIIKQQDEIKATTLANAGLKMNKRDFEKIYRGRIPSKYLINRGLPGAFPCPYCGAEEDRAMNEEQYCRCSVCGNYFFKVDPFKKDQDGRTFETVLKNDYGHDEKLENEFATSAKIEKWRNEHTAERRSILNVQKLKLTEKSRQDMLVILPKELGESIRALHWCDPDEVNRIETLVFPSNITNIEGLNFRSNTDGVNYIYLKNIVFACDEQGKYRLEPNQPVTVNRGVNVYGKYSDGKNIEPKII